jgi:phosphohistidine phosphatase
MELYVLRHAIALSCAEAGVHHDSERPLSTEGADKMKRIAAAFKTLGLEIDLILTSPYVRARDTAQIANDTLKTKLEFCEALASGREMKAVLDELKKQFRSAQRIMIVGHEPDLSQLIAKITSLGRLRLEMKKAGLAKIQITETSPELKGDLEFLLTPKVMLAIK